MSRAIVLDVETTGFSPHDDRVIELAIVDFETEQILFHSYFHPERPIPAKITEITGIDDAKVALAPRFRDLAGMIAVLLQDDVVAIAGHNPHFDRGMLSGEFLRAQVTVSWPTLICTKRLWDAYEPKEHRHLQNAYRRFVDPAGFDGAHGAMADTKACLAVLKSQIKLFSLEGKPWAEYDPDQTKWWGPSNHVIYVDGILVLNFGKNKGEPCHSIERSFWKWVINKDFPEHVKMLADYMIVVAKPNISGEELASWAYGRNL